MTVRGFVDAGYIDIRQSGAPSGNGGNLAWAYGNSQFTFATPASTFTVNQVQLALDAEREEGGRIYGARAALNYYPSRDPEVYQGGPGSASDRPYQVEQAYVFVEWPRRWNSRIVLGRAPGFSTLEQQEGGVPQFRLIGHSYVFQAGGGYPYGLQVHTWPIAGLAVRLGYSNGGLGDYGFYQGDTSTLDSAVARDNDQGTASDKPDGKTLALAADYVPFDRPAGAGTLRVGAAWAHNPALTYNAVLKRTEPYTFTNLYASYRRGDWELRGENAALRAFYESTGIGLFDASMYTLLLSWFAGTDHVLSLRAEHMAFVTDRDPTVKGTADKRGITWRYRVAEPFVIKVEAVQEVQAPQFWQPTQGKDLTTTVLATSWVYAF